MSVGMFAIQYETRVMIILRFIQELRRNAVSIVVGDEAYCSGVVCKLDDAVGTVTEHTIMGQRVKSSRLSIFRNFD